jgi:hypothetical protein
MKKMKIKCAAIIDKDGTVYTGHNHGLILQSQQWKERVKQAQMGFVTDNDIFVGRELAAMIAYEAKQIPKEVRKLFSEHLNYPEKYF